ncbi:ABC transporter ATP-binding protein [uncultured Vagococcus sp.]|uniref:ABC transporter ATP-binding protein n=1 Tax=uncultured Vagococcus sp. TaxID=189676 RepID=UPI0025899291|nr:ABC transporter ATP-binding protein [uncultured Vagococcus sp.]
MFSLLSYAKNYKKELILGPFFKLLEAILELLLPFYMAKLIDQGIKQNDASYTIKMGIYMLVMSVVGLICVLICQYYASIASQGFGTALREKMIQKINSFSHKEIDHFGTSTLITRTTSDINQLQLALAMLIRLVIRAPFLSIGSIIMAFYIDVKMGLIFITIIPIFSFILFLIMKKTVPLFKRVQERLDYLNETIRQNLTGVRVIRAFSKKEKDIETFGEASDELAVAYQNVTNISSLLSPTTTFIMNLAIIFILYFGGLNVNTGHLSSGEVVALINYMTQMLLALIVVANLVVIFTKAFASGERVKEIFETNPIITTNNQTKPTIWSDSEVVSFNHVSFKYTETSGLALKNINFTLKKGDTLGITGPTGSGKTTLTQLIAKFYPITSGELIINGKDISTYSTGELRQHIAYVPQKSVLFSGTIKSNLLMGNPNATDKECYEALKMADCLDFFDNLPEKLETKVLANGNNFSGGQKQRLSIARAFMKQPDILIMDDSLSALDYQTDFSIRKNLKTNYPDMTTIIISQRISSVKDARNILVLENGEQAGFGPHNDLLKTSKMYQKIVASQEEKEDSHE